MPTSPWLPLLDRAMASPVGLLLSTNDIARAKAQLYAARASAGGVFDSLQIRTSPWPDGDLVLCKGGKQRVVLPRAASELDI